ncbi:hypothetical protein [Paenibacillus montanisoli]|uniref:DUF4386 domain-containing protein n=1 Tax=Paenibacillus montanisoli TaxID=2081970 RepID=A0A328TS78_9BACL|nr:hypothetical protein [Paenibacillus montanisoli]RAP73419.1 hypothetical protein DL346_27335 [Paenibacillus montanisoli]
MVDNQALRSFSLVSAVVMVLSFVGMAAYFFLDESARELDVMMLILNSFWIISLISIYLPQAGSLGTFGRFSFIVTAIGLMWFVGYGFAHQFAGPVLEGFQPGIMEFDNLPQPLLDGAYVATAIAGGGFFLYGLSMLFGKVSLWQGILFMVSGAALAVGYAMHIIPLAIVFGFFIPIAVFSMNVKTLKSAKEG